MTTFKYDTINQIKLILRDRKFIDEFYSNNKEEFSNFLLSILVDTKYDLRARAEIAGDELYKIVNRKNRNEDSTFLDDSDSFIIINDKEELKKILSNCFKQKLDSLTNYDESVYSYYIKNLEEIKPGTRKIVITEEANKLMKEFLLRHPNEYLRRHFLREHPEPSFEGRFYHLDPFILYYFENWNSVNELLKSREVSDNFKSSQDESNFYLILLEVTKIAQQNDNKMFLITDKNKIELIEKFIGTLRTIELPVRKPWSIK